MTKEQKAIIKLAECIDQLERPYVENVRHKKDFRTRKQLIEKILFYDPRTSRTIQ